MKNKIALSAFIVIQILTMIILMLGEIQSIINGLEYRFQYLLILYVIIPCLVIGGIIESFAFKKLMNGLSVLVIFPFIVALSLLIAVSYEGNYNFINLSYVVISIELTAILLFTYTLIKVIQCKIH